MNKKLQPMRTPKQHCLLQALLAKDNVFSALAAANMITDADQRCEAGRLLDCARSDLEALDRLLRQDR